VTQLGPLGSDYDAMFEVVEVSDACFVHLLLQYATHAIDCGEFGGHSRGEMNFGVSLARNSTVAQAF